jgi:hypothetical protein
MVIFVVLDSSEKKQRERVTLVDRMEWVHRLQSSSFAFGGTGRKPRGRR